MNRHRRAAALVAVLATMAAGCSSSSDQPAPPLNQATSASSTTADCDDIERTFVGRERPAPGGHVQLDVFAVTASGGCLLVAVRVRLLDRRRRRIRRGDRSRTGGVVRRLVTATAGRARAGCGEEGQHECEEGQMATR